MFAIPVAPAPDPKFLIENFEPAYLRAYRAGLLSSRVEQALNELADCCLSAQLPCESAGE